nr:Chain P, Glycoprotein B [Human betaherpesvirus 5]
ETIYNTTLKY